MFFHPSLPSQSILIPEEIFRSTFDNICKEVESKLISGNLSLCLYVLARRKTEGADVISLGQFAMNVSESPEQLHEYLYELGWGCPCAPLAVYSVVELWLDSDKKREAVVVLGRTVDGRSLSHFIEFARGPDKIAIVQKGMKLDTDTDLTEIFEGFFAGYAQRVESQSGKPN